MSRFIKKFATDLEQIVEHCSWYLYDPICMNQPNVDILIFFINGLRLDGECGYDQSVLQIRMILLQKMWRLVFCKYTRILE